MGYALAEAAYARGADVVLVSGPSDLPLPFGVAAIASKTTCREMQRAAQALVKRAGRPDHGGGPADYRPVQPAPRSDPAPTARSRSSSRRPPTSSAR